MIELNVIPVYKRGFFCDDRSIAYKFTGDTVSMVTIMVVALAVPVGLVSSLEFYVTGVFIWLTWVKVGEMT